ncbi:uncharacterized protein LOC127361949 [Dicentrarchus labrax]|uniref:uncharacterized protein LOC127361949 n=1 Tax=Dicentrarchus labrax TaxID=13489 RepID=UPI0021F64D31|nr:uncharacterized protein LOC127361949 [Dicentrarchus labrax]
MILNFGVCAKTPRSSVCLRVRRRGEVGTEKVIKEWRNNTHYNWLNSHCSLFLFVLSDLSDAILHSMQRSRRLLFVLSPDFLAEKSFSLLECRLGLYLQHARQASTVSVVYRSVSKLPCVEVAQLRQAATATVTWRGSRSEPRRSRFWLRLRLVLPVRPLAMGRRLIDSTSSHSDLAAMALQRAQRIQNQRANQSRRNRRANQGRDRQAPPSGRGRVSKAEGHSRSCSGCTTVIGQVEDRGAELTVEMQQVSHDRTVPETEPAHIPDSTHDPPSTPDPIPDPDSDPAHKPNSDGEERQQMIGSGTSEVTVMSAGKGEGLVVHINQPIRM